MPQIPGTNRYSDGVAAVSKAEKTRKQDFDTIPSGRIGREGAEASDRRRSSFKESCKEWSWDVLVGTKSE